MFYELEYFAKSDSICNSDFDNELRKDLINLSLVSSLSKPAEYRLPLSGSKTGNMYSVLTMANGDNYFISTGMCYKVAKELEML